MSINSANRMHFLMQFLQLIKLAEHFHPRNIWKRICASEGITPSDILNVFFFGRDF